MSLDLKSYPLGDLYDETFTSPNRARSHARRLVAQLRRTKQEDLQSRQAAADLAIKEMGITFTVYGDKQQTERIFPFDLLPRIIPNSEWHHIEQGVRQRLQLRIAALAEQDDRHFSAFALALQPGYDLGHVMQ